MKKDKNKIAGWFWLAAVILITIFAVRHFHIKNFNIVQPDVLYTSGQPRGMDYTRLLYKYHIAAIVNIRSTTEHREENWHNEEITWVKNNGVKYIEIPIKKNRLINGTPDVNAVENFLAIMSDKTNLPVLLHDSSGEKRVAYLAAAWMSKSGKFSYEEIADKLKKINSRPLNQEEKDFIKSLTANIK